jgi:hypothetical protein
MRRRRTLKEKRARHEGKLRLKKKVIYVYEDGSDGEGEEGVGEEGALGAPKS